MDAKTQILVLTISFLYGFLIMFLLKFHNNTIKNKKRIYRSIITILLMYNLVLIYIIIIFKVNSGRFHPYFLLMIILGIYCNYIFTNKMLKNVKYRSFIEKIHKKWYTIKNKGD